MKRILVTGASGFVGRHALEHLKGRGFEVHAPDHHAVNLLEEAAQKALIESVRPTHLLHLAWDVTPGKYWTSLDNINWVRASLSLFQRFAENGGRRWVGAGTCAEYDWSCGPVLDENKTPLRPASLYGASKLSLGLLQEHMARGLGVSFAWGRIFYMYGPHEAPGRLVPSLVSSLLKGEQAVCKHDHLRRDMLHVDDVARAFVELLDSDHGGPVNIGSGQAVALGTVAQILAEACGLPALLELGWGRFPSTDPVEITADVRNLRSIGFTPRYGLEQGLRQVIAQHRAPTVRADRTAPQN